MKKAKMTNDEMADATMAEVAKENPGLAALIRPMALSWAEKEFAGLCDKCSSIIKVWDDKNNKQLPKPWSAFCKTCNGEEK